MDTSLMAALIGAQIGNLQLAVAARLARMNTDNASSVAKLLDAADNSANTLANAAAAVGSRLDVSA
jgi:hypothetical protein